MKLPNPFRRSEKPRRGSHIARGSISYQGDGLADRLGALGVIVHDPMRDAYEAGAYGRLQRANGAASHSGLTTDELPPGSKVTKAAYVGREGGYVWNGPE